MDGSHTALLLFGVTCVVVLLLVGGVTGRSGARRRGRGSDGSSSGVFPFAGSDDSPGLHGGGHTSHHTSHDGGGGSWGGGGSFDSGSSGGDSGGGGGGGGD